MDKIKTCVSLDKDTYKLLKDIAKTYHISVSALITYLVWDSQIRIQHEIIND